MQASPQRGIPEQRTFTRRRLFSVAAAATGTVVLAACGETVAPTPIISASTIAAPTQAPTQAPAANTVPAVAPTTQAPTAITAANTAPAAAATVGGVATAPAGTRVASAVVSSPAVGAATVRKVNANTASAAELQQAFEAAGIMSAARWVREVQEYRPYPANDPSFAKLRGELAKYNPSADTVDKIISTLAL